MIGPLALAARLQADLTRKVASFAGYISDSAPYVAPGCEGVRDCVRGIAADEARHAEALTRLIAELGAVPSPGTIDPTITDVNYLSVQYVAEMLLRALRRGTEQTSARVDQCDGQPRARAVLLEMLADERRHIEELDAILGPLRPAPPVVAAGATVAEGASTSKGGFNLKSFLAKRGGAPAGKAAAPSAAEPAPSDAAADKKDKPVAPAGDKKPFDMKAFLAKKKAAGTGETGGAKEEAEAAPPPEKPPAAKPFDVNAFLAKKKGAVPKAPAEPTPDPSAAPPGEGLESAAPAPEQAEGEPPGKKAFDVKAFLAKKKSQAPPPEAPPPSDGAA